MRCHSVHCQAKDRSTEGAQPPLLCTQQSKIITSEDDTTFGLSSERLAEILGCLIPLMGCAYNLGLLLTHFVASQFWDVVSYILSIHFITSLVNIYS